MRMRSAEVNDRLVQWLNRLPGTELPATVGGGLLPQPDGVVHAGDLVDNGDKGPSKFPMAETELAAFLADWGLNGGDGKLKWAVREMEDRYRKMARLGVRNIDGYNQRAAAARDKGEVVVMTVQTGFEQGTGEPLFEQQEIDLAPMPYIVVIVDEMADLMMVAGKEIEGTIQRLAQMARAAGIHLIMATQRPSVDVITGTIKANFPTRISFQVTSKIDSRTILGEQGAEQLLGQGDMLYMAGGGRITRVHGPFVSDREVESVVKFLKDQGEPEFIEDITAEEPEFGAPGVSADGEGGGSGDGLYDQAVALVARERKCSTSFIQRHLQIGYNRAARIVERMEAEGVVSTANHVGKREVLAPKGE